MRVVWTRDLGDGTDFISLDDQLVLMVHDSEVGPEERVLLDRPASYAKPLITPDGAAVVFTIRHQGAVYAVDWDGSGLRRVADGFGLDVVGRPGGRHDFIRAGRLVTGAERPAGERLRLALEPYDARPELEGKRLVLETTDLTLPLFYDVASADLTP